ncbi:MAG: 3,8-cyclase, partial [Campylobacterota bacterium]|nr:3,8-cyclase [Campylobacterota bacterium]
LDQLVQHRAPEGVLLQRPASDRLVHGAQVGDGEASGQEVTGVKDGDIEKAAGVLAQVLKDKPKENRWNEEENGKEQETSARAFYETGG